MAIKKKKTEMSVEDKLKNLYKLQTILSQIDKIKTLRGELPLEVQDLEDDIIGLTKRSNTYAEELKEYEKNISSMRNKILVAEASIERYKSQLETVRNNREFDTLSKEIEYQSLDIQLQEKKIKEEKRKIEGKMNDVEETNHSLEERNAILADKKKELDAIIAETQEEEDKLLASVEKIEGQIDERLLEAFKRIRNNTHNGLGVVYVQRGACGGCFNKIPPQRQLDVRMRKKIIVCEYCGRIMIDPELAGVKIEETIEEKPKRRKSTKRKTTED